MPTLSERSHAEYLCNVLNEHFHIEDVESDGECVEYISAEFKDKDNTAMHLFLCEMMGFVNRIAPKGYEVFVSEDGFQVREEKQ